jgi:hypothetical protein
MDLLFYTLDDIRIFANKEYRVVLNEDIHNVIDKLFKEIAPFENSGDDRVTRRLEKPADQTSSRNRNNKKINTKYNGSTSKDESIDEKWDRTPAFVATKIEVKEGIEKKINDIRILFNKITDKNYEIQKEAIIAKITEFSDDIDAGEDLKKISPVLFEIAKSNKFYSEIYARLYKELIDRFSFFNDTIEPFMNQFMDSLNTLEYVDANVNYDGFCNYNKMNENRRASMAFIVNLMKKNIKLPIDILDIIIHFQQLAIKYISEDNRVNEVDEITEVLSIVILMIYSDYKDNEKWNNEIFPIIKMFSVFKIKEKPSLSSRSIFKYKDIVDKITSCK